MIALSPEERASVFAAWSAAKAGSPVLTDLARAVVLMHRAGWVGRWSAFAWTQQPPEKQVAAFLPSGEFFLVLTRVQALSSIGKVILDKANEAGADLGKMAQPLVELADNAWAAVVAPFKFMAGVAVVAGLVGAVVLVVVVAK